MEKVTSTTRSKPSYVIKRTLGDSNQSRYLLRGTESTFNVMMGDDVRTFPTPIKAFSHLENLAFGTSSKYKFTVEALTYETREVKLEIK